ncbi:DUF397 domain-containing protein [Streptomyces sp. CoH27]|uniref:DUF397 domain-containing protein n=1 Tax=Streptomyces sp. CoH27 TaxID=2875763 RepID=UPI001CD5B034|nr:DUF397 domain-containing protein [Streptomyces sp. CoH27]
MPDFEFRKSSYSNEAAECVEVATNIPTTIAVRDSKNPTGPSLRLAPATWTSFWTALRKGRL